MTLLNISVTPGERLKGLDERELAQFDQEMRDVADRAARLLAESVRTEVRVKAQHQTGRLEKSISHFSYAGSYGVGAYVGWERIPLGRKSSFKDINGRIRKVNTVADVGRILEYSQTRVLRHMEPAYAAKGKAVEEQIEHEIERFLERIGMSK